MVTIKNAKMYIPLKIILALLTILSLDNKIKNGYVLIEITKFYRRAHSKYDKMFGYFTAYFQLFIVNYTIIVCFLLVGVNTNELHAIIDLTAITIISNFDDWFAILMISVETKCYEAANKFPDL
jgi:hypothetical protein